MKMENLVSTSTPTQRPLQNYYSHSKFLKRKKNLMIVATECYSMYTLRMVYNQVYNN